MLCFGQLFAGEPGRQAPPRAVRIPRPGDSIPPPNSPHWLTSTVLMTRCLTDAYGPSGIHHGQPLGLKCGAGATIFVHRISRHCLETPDKRNVKPRKNINLECGRIDPRLLPRPSDLTRSLRQVKVQHVRSSLDYCGPQGSHDLRCALADDLLRKRAIDCTASDVVITCGALHAIALLGMVLRQQAQRPTVGVEMPGYWGFRKTLGMFGIRVLSLPVDSQGARLDPAITDQCDAIILTPRHQFPTNVTLSPERRVEFLALADRGRCLVIEDDYSYGFHFLGEPPKPLLSGGLRRNGVYVGTFSKAFAPGLRMGYLVGAPDIVEGLTAVRWRIDRHSPEIVQLLLAEMIRSGVYESAISRTAGRCRKRWVAMNAALANHFGFRPSSGGGLSFWLSTGTSWRNLRAVVQYADLLGVTVGTGAECYDVVPRRGALRIGYTCADPHDIAVAVSCLARSFRHVVGKIPSCRTEVAPFL